MNTHDEEHAQANVENMIRSGKVQHTIECDLLFAEFSVYSQDRHGERHDWNEPRGCECEETGDQMKTETEVHAPTQKEVAQHVHADIYNVPTEKLRELQKQEPSNGGEICTICHVKGCRIGPMGRG